MRSNKAKKVQENEFIPLRPNIVRCMNFWKKQSLPGYCKDKGGTFNLDLYLQYLNAINQ